MQLSYEAVKAAFGKSGWSSDESWAETDLCEAMRSQRKNSAKFLSCLWGGFEALARNGNEVPSLERVNRVLEDHDLPVVIDPPDLRLKSGDIAFSTDVQGDSVSGVPIYKKMNSIGCGGSGIVYKVVRQTEIGEFRFAMKEFDPSKLVAVKPDRALARFKREIELVSRLQHRGIVTYIEAGIREVEKPYIIMELIEGTNIRDGLSGRPLSEIVDCFVEVLVALEYAHLTGVIHRDLKPSNVLVRESDSQPIIVDFGAAYGLEFADTKDLTSKYAPGTLGYVPKEVLDDPKIRSAGQDVYACGVMLYEVIGSSKPNNADYEPLADIDPKYTDLDAVIQKAIAPVRRRYATAKEFRDALQKLSK